MKRPYTAPEMMVFGGIHEVTGFLVSSQKVDFAWGPTGEVVSNEDDHGSQSFCLQPDGTLVPCSEPPGT